MQKIVGALATLVGIGLLVLGGILALADPPDPAYASFPAFGRSLLVVGVAWLVLLHVARKYSGDVRTPEYFSVSGRIGRRAFLLHHLLPTVVMGSAAVMFGSIIRETSIVFVAVILVVAAGAWVGISGVVKRLHDFGLPGGWLTVAWITAFVVSGAHPFQARSPLDTVVGTLLTILFWGAVLAGAVLPGSARENRYGPEGGVEARPAGGESTAG